MFAPDETHDTCGIVIRAPRRAGGVLGAVGKGAGQQGEGVRPASAIGNKLGAYMHTIVSLLKDTAGVSSIKMALMIGLSSSAVLVLVRIGVAAAGQ